MIPHDRLRTPATDGEILVEPAFRGGRTPPGMPDWVLELRQSLRARLRVAGPLMVTGHQCEFFHPGVFAKTIAARRIAERVGGQAVFVHVDSDTPKSTSVVSPARGESGIVRTMFRLPDIQADRPIELQSPPTESEWEVLFRRLAALQTGVEDSLLAVYARGWSRAEGGLADHFISAHRATEEGLGIDPLVDVKMSTLADTPEFTRFVARLVCDAGAVVETYNAAQAAYRRRHRVRNPGRPVPPLDAQNGRFESPLWACRRGADGRRHRLFIGSSGNETTLLTDDDQTIARIDRTELVQVVEHGGSLARGDWLIRPRALTLSAFCRLALADVFIHGIGGAKYDEVTDDFIRAWLGFDLPPILCVSATLRLPLTPAPVTTATASPRDVKYNPQRALSTAPAGLVARRANLVLQGESLRRDRAPRRDRRRVFDAIRAVNDQIVAACEPEIARLIANWEREADRRGQSVIARDREVFYALHSRTALAALAQSISEHVGA